MSVADILLTPLDPPSRLAVHRVATRYASTDRTLVMLQSNSGFVSYLRNIVCSMQRLHVRNWFLIALDDATCTAFADSGEENARRCVYPYKHIAGRASAAAYSNEHGNGAEPAPDLKHRMDAFDGGAGSTTDGPSITSQRASYGTRAFTRMVVQKPLWVRFLLLQDYNVIQCDLDIVWLHDPQPLLRRLLVSRPPAESGITLRYHPTAYSPPGAAGSVRHPRRIPRDPRNVRIEALIHANGSVIPEVPDVVFQSEQVHGLNSGFFFARPTAASVAFADLWLERIARQAQQACHSVVACAHAPWYHDSPAIPPL